MVSLRHSFQTSSNQRFAELCLLRTWVPPIPDFIFQQIHPTTITTTCFLERLC